MAQKAVQRVKTGFAVLALGFAFIGDGFRSYFGLPLYLVITAAFAVTYLVLLVQSRRLFSWRMLPTWFALFALTGVLAIAWAPEKLNSVTELAIFTLPAVIAAGISTLLPWSDLVRALGATMRWLMGLWLLTQFIFWAFRFEIKGILPTGTQLAFVCLIAVAVFSAELFDRSTWRPWTIVWIAATVVIFVFQFSLIAYWAAGAMVLVTALVVWARAIPQEKRMPIYLVEAATLIACLVAGIYFSSALQQGDYGVSWQAISSRLTWFGVLALALTGFGTLWRSWFIAVDRPRWGLSNAQPFQARSALPLLITVVLIVYSFDPFEAGLPATWLVFLVMTFATNLPGKIQSVGAHATRETLAENPQPAGEALGVAG